MNAEKVRQRVEERVDDDHRPRFGNCGPKRVVGNPESKIEVDGHCVRRNISS